MIIEARVSWSRLVKATPKERAWLDDYLSCDTVYFRPNRFGGKERVQDKFRMLHEVSGIFPSGFLRLILQAAAEEGIGVQVLDMDGGRQAIRADGTADLSWLRDYQRKGVLTCSIRGRGLIKLPTGGGKTEIFIGLTRVLPVEWLMVVHRSDLVGQAAERFQLRTGETAGRFENGYWRRGSANVTVATFQSIWWHMSRKSPGVKELVSEIEAVMVDEVHAQPGTTFYKVTQRLTKARYRFGMSGTPLDRGDRDNMRTIGAIGPIVYKVPIKMLQKRGLLAESVIRMVRFEQYGNPESNWAETYRDLVVRSVERNQLVVDIALRAEKPAFIFVEHLEHGRRLADMLRRAGLSAEFAQGDDSLSARRAKIGRLVKGHYDVLICTVIFQEGIDVPELAAVVNAAGKSSAIAVLQRIGRGMRVSKGKTTFEVWDIFDRGQTWLSQHATDRRRAYTQGGHKVKLVKKLENISEKVQLSFQDME